MAQTWMLLLSSVVLGWPSLASGQVTDAQLRARLDSLRPLLQEAAIAAEAERAAEEGAEQARAREELERTGIAMDTLTVGPIRIIAFENQVEVARALFGEILDESYGALSSSPSLDSVYFAFQWQTPQRALPTSARFGATVRTIDLNRVWTPTRAAAKDRVRDQLAETLIESLTHDTPLRVWLTGQGYGRAPGYPRVERTYRQLAARPSGATTACVAGVLDACAVALGLRTADRRVADWLTLETKQEMVAAGYFGDELTSQDLALAQACVEDADPTACDGALLQLVRWTSAGPLAGEATFDLFWYAVRRGGAGAWLRALEMQSAHPLDALSHIADIEGDRLVSDWRRAVLASRPDVHARLATTSWATLFWCLALTALAMRSTRCRLG